MHCTAVSQVWQTGRWRQSACGDIRQSG